MVSSIQLLCICSCKIPTTHHFIPLTLLSFPSTEQCDTIECILCEWQMVPFFISTPTHPSKLTLSSSYHDDDSISMGKEGLAQYIYNHISSDQSGSMTQAYLLCTEGQGQCLTTRMGSPHVYTAPLKTTFPYLFPAHEGLANPTRLH